MHLAYERVVEPVLTAIRRELGAIVAKLHRIDFNKTVDPMAGMGGSSFYMKDLVEKLSFIKEEVLSRFNVGEAGREWSVMSCAIINYDLTLTSIISGWVRLFNSSSERSFCTSPSRSHLGKAVSCNSRAT